MTTRRSLILAAPAVLTLARGIPAWAAGVGTYPFSLGVASGDPSPDGFVIWTRIAPEPMALDGLGGISAPVTVHWEVAQDEAMSRIAARGVVEADPRLAHTVHVEVADLVPDRPYWYRFTALGAQSPVGRARTAPAPDQPLDRLSLTIASCAHYETGYFSAYRHMADEAADLTLFLGDYIYEFTYNGRQNTIRWHGARTCYDLAGYRHRYACYRTDPDLQALHAAAPCLVTWDDHEVENDYADLLSQTPSVTPEEFGRRRAAAYQAFYEHMPIRRTRLEGASLPIHKTVRYGRLAEFYLLDTRQYRSPQACLPDDNRRARVVEPDCAGRSDPARTMLGLEQEAWLYDRFRRSGADWNLIAQSLLAAPLLQKGPGELVGHWTDGWDGYPASRDRMLKAMQESRLANPVILSGDIHSFWANELKADPRDPGSQTLATEFVGTAISANGPPAAPFSSVYADNPHVRYFDLDHHGYISADLTRERMQTRFRAISDRRDMHATVSTLREFTVENGRPAIIV